MRTGIHEDALQAMLDGGAVREVLSAGTMRNRAWQSAWPVQDRAGCPFARKAAKRFKNQCPTLDIPS